MLGFSAIADTPIAADNRQDQYLVVGSQTLALTENSVALSTGVALTLSQQSLITTLNSPTIQAAANYALQSQNLALTQNSVALSTEQTIALQSQTLALTQNSVSLSTGVTQPLGSQSLTTTLNSVALNIDQVLAVGSQTLSITLNSVSVVSVNTISVTGLALNIAVQGSGAALDGDNAAIAALPLCAIPYPDPVITYTAVRIDEFPAVTGQTLNLSVSNVSIFNGDDIPLSSQVLSTGLNSVAVLTDAYVPTLNSQALNLTVNDVAAQVQPPTFDSQSITLTQNGVTFSTGATYTAPAYELNLTVNSVGIGQLINLPSQTATVTVRSVSVVTDQSLVVDSQSLLFTLKRVSLVTDQTVSVGSQTIYTEINGLRLWQSIDTQQTQSCNDWVPGTWEAIQFGDLIYGDNFAIGATPVASIEECEPIRKTPPQSWGQVDSTTTTTWSTIQT